MKIYSFFRKSSFELSRMAIAVSFALITQSVNASEKLDMSFIQGGHNIDKDAWSMLNGNIVPGRYLVDVVVNGKTNGKQILDVTSHDNNGLCLKEEWLSKVNIFINKSFFKEGYDTSRQCYNLSKGVSTTVELDVPTQTLTFNIPQQGLVETPENVEWDYGTSAFRMNYNINANTGRNYSSAFGSAALKANIGNWVVDSTATSTAGGSSHDSSIDMLTATRAIRFLQADLAVGRIYAGDSLLGSAGVYGVSLKRNNSMKPGNLGYSPVFSGIANGPSRVTLSQGGRILYSEVVPAGPFSITDVPLYTSGDVRMSVTGEDGHEDVRDFPMTVMTGLLNPGQHEFTIAGGVADDNSNLKGGILSASYGYGLNELTLQSGVILNQDYQGVSAGVVTSLGQLGAVSADGAWSVAKYDAQSSRRGSKAQLAWSKKLESTGTGLRVSWSRTQNDKFTELTSFNPTDLWFRDKKNRDVRDEWNVGISQPVRGLFSLSASAWQRSYHNYSGKDAGLSGSLSTQIAGVSLNLGATGARSTTGRENWAVSASVSIPFTLFEKRYSSSFSVTSSKGQGVGFSSGLSTSLNDKFSYGINGGRDSNGTTTSGLNMSYSGDKVALGGTLNHSSNIGTSGSVSLSGSVLAVPAARSVMFSKTTSDTVAVVGIKDTPGVKVTSGTGGTDANGNLVVPLNSYGWNSITIDAGSLPTNTELTTTSKKVVPTDKAVVWMPFEPVKVKRYLLQVKQKNGEFVDGGTWARDSRNTPLGFVANNGVLMINAVDTLGDLTLGTCRIPATKLKDIEKLQEITCE
ncbi:PefC/AfrB family outer membrane usher protein [Yersinia enterocolitica]|uniref:PefC/AfrB family outer membrane usher protein n=1 Tax=Yersinia enterocolitica TaxID=630 RepID=UPI0030CE31DD|nr:PefC/AfrB family outer membrane usher protein [Yersinia enterocolitica]